MIFDPAHPPKGTVRDWLDARATADGIAVVFPETSETLTWRGLRDEARDMAQKMAALGIDKGESVAIIHPNGRDGFVAT
jgi:acyl-CoA synthetase (AMP-forming)/AMP-acid ligase II